MLKSKISFATALIASSVLATVAFAAHPIKLQDKTEISILSIGPWTFNGVNAWTIKYRTEIEGWPTRPWVTQMIEVWKACKPEIAKNKSNLTRLSVQFPDTDQESDLGNYHYEHVESQTFFKDAKGGWHPKQEKYYRFLPDPMP